MKTAAVAAIVVLLASPLGAADPPDPGGRVMRVEQWVRAVLEHTPGADDESALALAGWSVRELGTFRIDIDVFLRLMRDPRLSTFETKVSEALDCLTCIARGEGAVQARQIQRPQQIRYTQWQLHRLKVLACAAAGTITSRECAGLKAADEIDADLRRLADNAQASTARGAGNYVIKRGALLETDLAMLTASSFDPIGGPLASGDPVRVHLVDGEQTRVGLGDIHWDLGRLLLDGVDAKTDPMPNAWYRATATWMQRDGQYNTRHLAHALELFPDDATLAFLRASQSEVYASAGIQSAVRSAKLPGGVTLEIGAARAELENAERFFRRAVRLDPGLVEARVRLAHVLLARGRPQEAADELRQVDASRADSLVQYYGAMFLGASEEALGRVEQARDAYARAAAIYPTAQSPYLAMSALAATTGHRAEGLELIHRLFDLSPRTTERPDPWWAYFTAQGRSADELLEGVRRPFLESPR